MKRTHIDLFNDNNWGWTLGNAIISGGVLEITVAGGSGKRYPGNNWFHNANDDFILEYDFKLDATPSDDTLYMSIKLVDDINHIIFNINKYYNLMRIVHVSVRASQAYTVDTSWHTVKIRRVGTTYYFSIDGGTEISWDYGTERAVEYINLRIKFTTGEFDNFKYFPINIPVGAGIGNPLIL